MILSFSEHQKFISESTISSKADTKEGQRHIQNYIDPYLPGKEKHGADTHTLAKAHGDIPAGTKLTFKGKRTVKGVTHVMAIPKGGKKATLIPAHKITKISEKDGKHNEEHAVKKMWNHFSGKVEGANASVEDMHNEIEKAKTDKTHPLHIKNAEDNEFAGKISGNNAKTGNAESRKRAKESYYQNLKDAAYTVHAMKNHPDFKKHWKEGDKLEHAGKAHPELSDHYKAHGVRGAGATSKGDALIMKSSKGGKVKGVKAISFKKTGGSQLMSSSPAEFHAIYSHALKKAGKDIPENLAKVKKAREHMEKGEHEPANKIVQGLHDEHPDLIHHVTHEALSGEGKFKTDEGRASHVAEIGKDAKVMTTKEFMDAHQEPIARSRPRVRASKHGGTASTVSLETPKLPKRPKKLSEQIRDYIKMRKEEIEY